MKQVKLKVDIKYIRERLLSSNNVLPSRMSCITWGLMRNLRSDLMRLNSCLQINGGWWVKPGIRKITCTSGRLTLLHWNYNTHMCAMPGRKRDRQLDRAKSGQGSIGILCTDLGAVYDPNVGERKRRQTHLPCKWAGRWLRGFWEIWHELNVTAFLTTEWLLKECLATR